jgi:hypothetical protein
MNSVVVYLVGYLAMFTFDKVEPSGHVFLGRVRTVSGFTFLMRIYLPGVWQILMVAIKGVVYIRRHFLVTGSIDNRIAL